MIHKNKIILPISFTLVEQDGLNLKKFNDSVYNMI